MNIVLWIVQVVLALLFLFAGEMKLILPLDKLTGPVAFPGWFVRFLGAKKLDAKAIREPLLRKRVSAK